MHALTATFTAPAQTSGFFIPICLMSQVTFGVTADEENNVLLTCRHAENGEAFVNPREEGGGVLLSSKKIHRGMGRIAAQFKLHKGCSPLLKRF